jgi:hypothetical protein
MRAIVLPALTASAFQRSTTRMTSFMSRAFTPVFGRRETPGITAPNCQDFPLNSIATTNVLS